MTEAVVERAELEAPAEEVFEYWAKLENFCAFVRSAEESRRVDLSGSRWLLKGPRGRSVEYEPEAFRRCLVGYRNRLVHGSLRGNEPEPDVVLDRGELEFKHLSDGTTLLLLTYLADRPDEPGDYRRTEDSDLDRARNRQVYLHLNAILSHLLHEARSDTPGERRRGLGAVQPEGAPTPGALDGVIALLDEWAADDSGYDEETLPALKENLDRNRPEYRKLFGRS